MSEQDVLAGYKKLFNTDELDMKIENNSMIITPSSVGVVILSMLELGNKREKELVETLTELTEKYEFKLDELSITRNYLEELVERLNDVSTETNLLDITKDILSFLYPISVVGTDGIEHKLAEDTDE